MGEEFQKNILRTPIIVHAIQELRISARINRSFLNRWVPDRSLSSTRQSCLCSGYAIVQLEFSQKLFQLEQIRLH
jgi:hypothetical protein